MNSHEYAARLKAIADFLLLRPEFKAANKPMLFQMFYEKDGFLAAVKALGSGTKEVSGGAYPEVKFQSLACPELRLSIPRDKVCRKVQDVVWECEPFLSQQEEKSLTGA